MNKNPSRRSTASLPPSSDAYEPALPSADSPRLFEKAAVQILYLLSLFHYYKMYAEQCSLCSCLTLTVSKFHRIVFISDTGTILLNDLVRKGLDEFSEHIA